MPETDIAQFTMWGVWAVAGLLLALCCLWGTPKG